MTFDTAEIAILCDAAQKQCAKLAAIAGPSDAPLTMDCSPQQNLPGAHSPGQPLLGEVQHLERLQEEDRAGLDVLPLRGAEHVP